jgi:signal transduction histidine kinase
LEKLAGLGILLSGISHEILNPLSGISGPLAVLKNKIGNTDKDVYKNINYIEESVERIESIVNNLKDLYRTDNLPLTESKIKPIIQKAWEETKYLTDKNILLSIIMDDEIKLKIHEFSFLQILINLFRNSIEAFEKTGTIKIRLEHQEKSKELIFEDNGIGIKNKEIINVFNPFYTSKPFTNMGMGLFIVKNLAEHMNWDISLLSGINSGTKVIFTVR